MAASFHVIAPEARGFGDSSQAAERMVAGRPNASLVTVPGAGHFVPIEAPEAFEATVRRWLQV